MQTKTKDLDLVDLPLDRLFLDFDFNCRGFTHADDVLDLITSMRVRGLQSPIDVRPWHDGRYQVVSGYRRSVAAKTLGWDTIPGFIHIHLDDSAALAWNLEENVQRKDLNILQEARALGRICSAGATIAEAARMVNRSFTWAATRCQLLKLPEEIQKAAAAGLISQQNVADIYRAGHRSEAKFRSILDARQGRRVVVGRPAGATTKAKKARPLDIIETRTGQEISDMAHHIRSSVDCPLAMKALAWTCGYLSDPEIYESIAELAKAQGKEYSIPENGPTS